MKRISLHRFIIMFVLVIMILSAVSPGFADEDSDSEGSFAPLSQAFLDWQKEHTEQESSSGIPVVRSTASSEYPNGYIPIPVDFSHLANNPPREESERSPVPNVKSNVGADALPSAFDLRNVNGKSYVTSVKDQGSYGTCWAHAAIGSMESNYLMQGKSELDLSEMHIAWYTYKNSNKSRAFNNYSSSSFSTVMGIGGNAFYPAALCARLSGPVSESDVPYGSGQPSAGTPESYTRRLRLRDAYYLSRADTINVNASEAQRNIIKRLIMQNGSIAANYHNDNSAYKKVESGNTSYHTTSRHPNHAVQIVGWDDNYPAENFRTNPGINGAWLIKNSWGDRWYTSNGFMGDSGYFWMSYATYLTEGTSFVVEDVDNSMKVYEYDPLGICALWGYGGSTIYAANVFRADENETLKEIGIYTADNNLDYEINIYTGMSSMPSKSPVSGSSRSYSSGTIAFAGYHVIALDTPVELSEGEYFSVVVKFKGYGMTPVEKVVSGFSNNAVIEEGSFFSKNGSTWTAGTKNNMNACIKAFTTTGSASGTAPKMSDGYPPDGQRNVPYSATLKASGTKPITWSVSRGKLPEGLTLDSDTGTISGTPTEKTTQHFTIKASNAYGDDTKNFSMNIWDLPSITTESLDGYAGYAFNGQLSLSPALNATWKAASTMPSGLRLNAKTGAITGKPSGEGEYTVTFQATTSLGVSEKDVKIFIYEKPEKPAFKTSKLENGFVAEKYLEDEDYIVVIGGEEYLNINEEHFYFQTIDVTGTSPIDYYVDNSKTNLPDFMYINVIDDVLCIGGFPIKAGTFSVTFLLENEATRLENKPVTKTYKLVIKERPPVIDFTGDSLPDARAGEEYSYKFTLSSGTKPVTWTASGLPSGMKFSNGTLSGKPTAAGNFKITLNASNAGGRTTVKIPIAVLQAPVITKPNFANAVTDKSYTAKITAKGTTPISWDVSGLPDTLTYSYNAAGTTLTISGTPEEIDTYSLTIKASSRAGSSSVSANLKVIGTAPTLTASLGKGTVNSSYNGSKISAKGTKPITFAYSISASDKKKFGIDSLEDLGLSFSYDSDEGTAEITGSPTRSVKSLPITITADNAASKGKSASKTVKLTISGEKPSFTEPEDSTVNLKLPHKSSVQIDFTVTGTPDIVFSMNKTTGYTLTQTGANTARLTGTTPSKDGKINITVTATNADGKATRKITVQTMTAPKITTASLTSGTLNKSYSVKIAATGTRTIIWTLDGELPYGMTFNNGQFRGRPTEAGTFNLTVTAENDAGSDTKNFTLRITDPNAVTSIPEKEPDKSDSVRKESESESKPETKPESESESASKHVITSGRERDESSLSSEQSKMLSDEGYVIAAVLPELKVSESGMYEIDAELYEDIEKGAELFWFAFPKERETTSDDEIAEFYDESGADIKTVPESHKITVAAWLTEGITYEPVIAVKSKK